MTERKGNIRPQALLVLSLCNNFITAFLSLPPHGPDLREMRISMLWFHAQGSTQFQGRWCEEFVQKALELGMGECCAAACRCSPWDTENPGAAVGRQNVSWCYFLLVIFKFADTKELFKSSFCISQECACKEPLLVVGILKTSTEGFY